MQPSHEKSFTLLHASRASCGGCFPGFELKPRTIEDEGFSREPTPDGRFIVNPKIDWNKNASLDGTYETMRLRRHLSLRLLYRAFAFMSSTCSTTSPLAIGLLCSTSTKNYVHIMLLCSRRRTGIMCSIGICSCCRKNNVHKNG